MFGWFEESSSNAQNLKNLFDTKLLRSFNTKLHKQKEKAVTLDLFLNDEQLGTDSIRRNTGRLISYHYTKRHIDLFDGDLLCGLPHLSFYDQLSTDKILNHYSLIKLLLNKLSIPSIFYVDHELDHNKLIAFLTHTNFPFFQSELLSIIIGLTDLVKSDLKNDLTILKKKIIELFVSRNKNISPATDDHIQASYTSLMHFSTNLFKFDAFNISYQMAKKRILEARKILIVVATEIEAKVFLEIMEHKGNKGSNFEIDKQVYWNMGIINNSEIIMVKSSMGSAGSGGSTLTINDAITHIRPAYIIMIGIAFGLKKDKQEIGRILVSRQLENYELSKVMDGGTIQRADKISAGVALLNRFENAVLSFKSSTNAQVESGLIISGDKLIDSKNLIERLKTIYPEAIGGEMEGTGLQASSYREKVDWILIKGICDWGYDKQTPDKDANQKLAINNVCDFLIHTLINFKF